MARGWKDSILTGNAATGLGCVWCGYLGHTCITSWPNDCPCNAPWHWSMGFSLPARGVLVKFCGVADMGSGSTSLCSFVSARQGPMKNFLQGMGTPAEPPYSPGRSSSSKSPRSSSIADSFQGVSFKPLGPRSRREGRASSGNAALET